MSMSEGKYTAEFLISEAPGSLSRENVTVTVAAGAKYSAGHVLALVGTKYVEYDNAGTDGSQTAAAVLYGEVDNSDGQAPADFAGVIVARLAEVRNSDLTYFAGASGGDKSAALADLATKYIVAR